MDMELGMEYFSLRNLFVKGYEMTDELAVTQQDTFMAPVVTVEAALRAYQAKKELIDGIMKKDVDYGVIPGSSKPTLLKAGAEKATSFFGLSPRFADAEVVNDWTGEQHGGEPFFYYRRTCNLWRGPALVASVDGSCNSWEKKYRYRSGERICPKCGKGTIIKGKAEYGGGWLCFSKKGGCGAKFPDDAPEITSQEIGQVKNPDVSDLVNTILKMADKRALVAATLIATGMSEYFTQDIDDFVTGEFVDVPAHAAPEVKHVPYEVAAAVTITDKGVEKRLDSLTPQQLTYVVEHNKDAKKVDAALTVLEHDHQIPRPGAD